MSLNYICPEHVLGGTAPLVIFVVGGLLKKCSEIRVSTYNLAKGLCPYFDLYQETVLIRASGLCLEFQRIHVQNPAYFAGIGQIFKEGYQRPEASMQLGALHRL